MDESDLQGRAQWKTVIEEELRKSDYVAFVQSRQTNERSMASGGERSSGPSISKGDYPQGFSFLIPVRLENCKNDPMVSHLTYLDLYESQGFEKLVRTIRRDWERRKREYPAQFSMNAHG